MQPWGGCGRQFKSGRPHYLFKLWEVNLNAMAEEKEIIGITVKKSEDFSEWYNQVVLKAKLADFTAVKGFMAILPNAYEVWEEIQEYFNAKIKALGHRNAYFPAVIPESFLV